MSEELSREIEIQLMGRYHLGDQKAVSCLAEIAAITLNAAAEKKSWEDAAHQVIHDLLVKPAATLTTFNPAKGPLMDYLMGRVRGKIHDQLLADGRRREREHQAAADKVASESSPPIDWRDFAEGVRPRLTRKQWVFVLNALQNYYGPMPQQAEEDAKRAAVTEPKPAGAPAGSGTDLSDTAFWQMVSRIRRKVKEAEAAEEEKTEKNQNRCQEMAIGAP